MFGCVYFIQSRNSWLLFIDKQSNNQTIFLFSCNFNWVIWMCKYGNRILWTYCFIVSNVYQWFSLKVNSQFEFMHLSSPSIDGGRHRGVILVNTILLGSKTLFQLKIQPNWSVLCLPPLKFERVLFLYSPKSFIMLLGWDEHLFGHYYNMSYWNIVSLH